MSHAVVVIFERLYEEQNIKDVHPMRLDEHNIFNEHPDTWSKRFAKICDDNGFINLKLHDLRHHAITKLVKMKSFTIHEVSEITGHKDLQMLHRYANHNPITMADKFYREKGRDDVFNHVQDRFDKDNKPIYEEDAQPLPKDF